MKHLLCIITVVLMGCAHTAQPMTTSSLALGIPRPHLPTLVINAMGTDGDNPYQAEPSHTWATLEDIRVADDMRLQLLMQEEVRKSRNGCALGDPNCAVIEGE